MNSGKITDVTGIGPSSAALLSENGIRTVEELARASVRELAEIRGFRGARANRVIAAATEFLEKNQPSDRPQPTTNRGDTEPTEEKAEKTTPSQAATGKRKAKKKRKKDSDRSRKNKNRDGSKTKSKKNFNKKDKKSKKKSKGKRGGKKKKKVGSKP